MLTDVSCDGLTLRGTGVVTVHAASVVRPRTVTVDLGPSQVVDAAGLHTVPIYGTPVHVDLR